jgi:hypothetical protein
VVKTVRKLISVYIERKIKRMEIKETLKRALEIINKSEGTGQTQLNVLYEKALNAHSLKT